LEASRQRVIPGHELAQPLHPARISLCIGSEIWIQTRQNKGQAIYAALQSCRDLGRIELERSKWVQGNSFQMGRRLRGASGGFRFSASARHQAGDQRERG
jgi:hypothetical protein